MSSDFNCHNQNYKNPSVGLIIGGVLAGNVVKNLVVAPQRMFATSAMGKIEKISDALTADEFKQVTGAMDKALTKSGLRAKGVGIVRVSKGNASEVTKILEKEFNKGIAKFLPKKFKEKQINAVKQAFINGKNACYASATNKIVLPKKKMSLGFFHEAGHAMNANLSKTGKILQKSRLMTLLATPIALIALFKTKKAEGEQPKNKMDKTTTFIKENAGKLTFATFLPVLIEEGLATRKGNKLAKELLSSNLAKKVAKTNALGFSTYLMMATLSGLGVFLGTKIKDTIAHKKAV